MAPGDSIDPGLYSGLQNIVNEFLLGISQYFSWIDPRRAMRGEPRGERADRREDRGGADERRRIARLETVEERGDEFRRPHADAASGEHPDRDEQRHARQHEADDAARRRAERHADADLGASSRHGVRRDAVEAEAR